MTSNSTTGTGSGEANNEDDDDDDDDEWKTIQKPTRRRRPQRRQRQGNHQRNHHEGVPSKAPASSNAKDASAFFEKAVAAALRASVAENDNDEDNDNHSAATPEQIVDALNVCLRELNESEYWERIRLVLRNRAETNRFRFRSIVCYGIGNFGTKRPSAPTWQLALALMIREYITGISISVFAAADASQQDDAGVENNENDPPSSPETPPKKTAPVMYYYEPLMTNQEAKVLEQFGIRVIEENERGKRSVDSGNDNDDEEDATLFFMPHCPMSLYTNVFHTNWDSLRNIIIFGNCLSNYIDGGNTSIVSDPQKQQALKILEVLQPFWEVDNLKMSKKDIADRAAYFEKAFNDSSFTSFSSTSINSRVDTAPWPERPHLDTPRECDGGEVL